MLIAIAQNRSLAICSIQGTLTPIKYKILFQPIACQVRPPEKSLQPLQIKAFKRCANLKSSENCSKAYRASVSATKFSNPFSTPTGWRKNRKFQITRLYFFRCVTADA